MSHGRSLLTSLVLLGVLLAADEAFADDRTQRDIDEPEPTSEIVWVDGEVGYEAVDMRTFEVGQDLMTVGLAPTTGSGPAFGVGAGIRLVFVTLGARARVGLFEDDAVASSPDGWQLWTMDGELGIRIPLGRLEPHFVLAAGYAGLGSVDDAVAGIRRGLDITGANVRAGGGLDYHVTPRVSLGAKVAGELLFLSRSGVPVRDLAEPKRVGTLNEAQARVLEADRSSVGSAFTLTGGAGLHF